MTPNEAQTIVRATFTELGLDASDPHAVIEAQRDFAFLRRQRKVSERIGVSFRLTIIGLVLTGLATVLWLGIRQAVGK